MRLQDNIDFTTLTWVKPELDETLRQARQALETHVEHGGDRGQMQVCAAQGWDQLDHSALVKALELMAHHDVAAG